MNIFDKSLEDGTLYRNPYPIYAQLREHSPILWSKTLEAWIITKYSDIDLGISSKPVTVKRKSLQTENVPKNYIDTFEVFFEHWLMYQEAPEHAYKREWSKYLFDKGFVEEIAFQAGSLAGNLINQIKMTNEFDLVSGYAKKIGLFSICSLVGITGVEELIFDLSNKIVDFMQGRYKDFNESMNESRKAIEQLESIIESRVLKSSLFSSMSNQVQDYKISKSMIISILGNILVDGHEPIANTIVNSIVALQDFPEQCTLIRSNPDILKQNVDELIRFDPPFQYIVRHAEKRFTIRKTQIQQGERILFMIASANRDHSVFSNADSIDLLNQAARLHRSFGFGRHFCIGASLARKVVAISVQKFISEVPQFTLHKNHISRHLSLGSRAIYIAPVTLLKN